MSSGSPSSPWMISNSLAKLYTPCCTHGRREDVSTDRRRRTARAAAVRSARTSRKPGTPGVSRFPTAHFNIPDCPSASPVPGFLTESRKLSSRSALSPSFLRNSGSCLVDITAGAGPRCRAANSVAVSWEWRRVNLPTVLSSFKTGVSELYLLILYFAVREIYSRDEGSKHVSMTWRTILDKINNCDREGSVLRRTSQPSDWSNTGNLFTQ